MSATGSKGMRSEVTWEWDYSALGMKHGCMGMRSCHGNVVWLALRRQSHSTESYHRG